MSAWVLVVVGCATRAPSGPSDALGSASPETSEQVAEPRASSEELDRRAAQAAFELERASANATAASVRLEALEDALRADRELRASAEARGDAAAVNAVAVRIAENERLLSEASVEAARAGHAQLVASAELELLRAERDLADARMELETATAVDGARDLELGRFRRAVNRATARRDAALENLEALRILEAPPTSDASS